MASGGYGHELKHGHHIFFSSTTFNTSTMASNFKTSLPTMSTEKDIGIDIQSGYVPTNNSEVRGRNPLSSINSFRDSSMASSG